MLEKEKMINGEMYDPGNLTLCKDRIFAKQICYEYNQLPPYPKNPRKDLIKKLFAKTGQKFTVEPVFYCDYGYNIEIGENFYSNHNLVILDCAKVTFGDNVFIGPNCGFYTAEHPLDAQERAAWLEYARPIKVGNNVWFGGGVNVISGITIGDNAVIGAGSVVVKDIPPNCVAVGNPCKVIKQL